MFTALDTGIVFTLGTPELHHHQSLLPHKYLTSPPLGTGTPSIPNASGFLKSSSLFLHSMFTCESARQLEEFNFLFPLNGSFALSLVFWCHYRIQLTLDTNQFWGLILPDMLESQKFLWRCILFAVSSRGFCRVCLLFHCQGPFVSSVTAHQLRVSSESELSMSISAVVSQVR